MHATVGVNDPEFRVGVHASTAAVVVSPAHIALPLVARWLERNAHPPQSRAPQLSSDLLLKYIDRPCFQIAKCQHQLRPRQP